MKEHGTLVQVIPELEELESDLLDETRYYNESPDGARRGLYFTSGIMENETQRCSLHGKEYVYHFCASFGQQYGARR